MAGTLHASMPASVPSMVAASTLNATAAQFSPAYRKEFYGAIVEFGSGAAIISVSLPTDCSSIQIKGLGDTSAEGVKNVLDMMSIAVSQTSISFNESPAGFIATVKFDHTNIAKLVVDEFSRKHPNSRLCINQVVALAKPSEWVQLGGVRCSWDKTSRMAFMEYRSNTPRLDELPHAVSQLLTPSGRRVKCVATTVSSYEATRSLRSFTLNNLDVDTDTAWIENALVGSGFPPPKKIKIKEVGRDAAAGDDECVHILHAVLNSVGLLESFSSSESVDQARKLVTANFSSQFDAQKAVLNLQNAQPDGFPASKKLVVEQFVSMKINMPNKIFTALESQIQTLRADTKNDGRTTLKIVKDTVKPHTTLRFSDSGTDPAATIAKIKFRLEKLLAGAVVSENYVPLWHPWFASSDAGGYLHWVSSNSKLYVHRSTGKGNLIIYGGTYDDRRRACMILETKIQDLHAATAYTIPLIGGRSIPEVLDILKPVFGNKVRLVSSDGAPKIKLCGSVADIRKARLLLDPGAEYHSGDCVICLTQPDEGDAIHLGCGHIYCKDCFINQSITPNEHLLPLKCFGVTKTKDECTHRIELSLLREHLPFANFESVLKLSVDVYFRTHPNDFGFCRTTDCETIYRRAAVDDPNPPLTTCTGCLQTYDRFCGRSHSGISCKDHLDAVDGTDAFTKYCKERGIKNCPQCRVPAVKWTGCNHMLCSQCHTHYCWLCLEIFLTGTLVYDHLIAVHGSIGLNDEIPQENLHGIHANLLLQDQAAGAQLGGGDENRQRLANLHRFLDGDFDFHNLDAIQNRAQPRPGLAHARPPLLENRILPVPYALVHDFHNYGERPHPPEYVRLGPHGPVVVAGPHHPQGGAANVHVGGRFPAGAPGGHHEFLDDDQLPGYVPGPPVQNFQGPRNGW